MPINVYIDQEAATSHTKTGVGYFTKGIIDGLSGQDSLRVSTYQIGGKRDGIYSKILLKAYRLFRYAGIDLPLYLSCRTSKQDVVIGANYLIPPTSSDNTIPVIHDLCFIDHPEWVQPRNAFILRKMLKKTITRSAGVITISKFSASRIRAVYGYKKPILVVDIPPVSNVGGRKKPHQDIIPNKFFLFVGTIEPRKNISTLLEAFESTPRHIQDTYKLVIAGKAGWDPEVLSRLKNGRLNNVIYLDYVSDENKNWLYKNATATIVPSHYEGFGMMTLESLVGGAPVITSEIPPLVEIMGTTGLYFKPSDSTKLSLLIGQMTSSEFRDKIYMKQQLVLDNYSWEKTTQSIESFIEEIAKRCT